MRKTLAAVSVLVLVSALSICYAFAKNESAPVFKAGDTVYVCGCGAGCDCGTVSGKNGTCGCGMDLVKSTITKVENGRLYYKVNSEEMSAPATGKYVCACGSGCPCNTISQKPGKCGCGQTLKKME